MQMFEDMDSECRGVLTGADVYAYFRVEAPALAMECLQATTLLRREKLEYHEMLMTVYNFCTLPPNRIGDFVFQVLDDMGAGSIEKEVVLDSIPRIHEKCTPEELEVMTRRVRKVIHNSIPSKHT
jgi:Ca2+-binding EF-hand superfamily protein